MNIQLKKKPTGIALCALMIVAIICAIVINPFESGSDLALETDYFKFFLCVTIAIELGLFYYLFTNQGEIKYETVFTLLFLAFGLIYLFAITPLSCPDEQHHYQSAYSLANMLLGQNMKTGNAADFEYTGYVLHQNVATGYLRIMRDFFSSKIYGETVAIPGPYNVAYICQHLPQALGIIVARGLRLNSLHIYQFGRLFNLILTTVCLNIALRSTPRFKMLIGMVFLMPMAIQQASSYSYDCFVNAMTVLSLGLLLKAIWGEGKIKAWELIVMFAVNLVQAPAKTTYAFIALLVFFIPKERFEKTWMKWAYSIVYAACCLGFSLYIYKQPGLAGAANELHNAYTSAKPMYSFGWIASHPADALKVYWTTFVHNGPFYVASCIGRLLSGLSLRLPAVIVCTYGAMSVLATFIEGKNDEKCQLKKGMRAVCIIVPIVVGLIILTVMMTAWTYNDSPWIEGVQGRYFLPVVPMLFMGFSSLKFKIKEEWSKYFIMGSAILQLTVVICIFLATNYGIMAQG